MMTPEEYAIDQGLRELVGGRTPPDLSERIFSKARRGHPADEMETGRGRKIVGNKEERAMNKVVLTAAAVLCIAIGGVLGAVLFDGESGR